MSPGRSVGLLRVFGGSRGQLQAAAVEVDGGDERGTQHGVGERRSGSRHGRVCQSWTRARSGWPFGWRSRPPFWNSPTSSFFLLPTEIRLALFPLGHSGKICGQFSPALTKGKTPGRAGAGYYKYITQTEPAQPETVGIQGDSLALAFVVCLVAGFSISGFQW